MTKHNDVEIERVFKVRQVPKNIEQNPSQNIIQGYLAIDVTGKIGHGSLALSQTVIMMFELSVPQLIQNLLRASLVSIS
jgi:hypothetical protein